MSQLHKRVAKLHFAKGAAFDKCMGDKCSKAPEVECIWADGRGRAWHCQKCHDKWVKENEDSEGDEGWLPVAIVKQREVPNGTVGEEYGEYPETKKAKAEGKKEWGGESVGLFIPLPARLAKRFPSLGEEDTSPSHVTFLYIGDIKDEAQQKHLIQTLRDVHGKWWPKVTATLGNLAHFEHPDKDRRVAHVQVEFDKDLSGMRHRVKQALIEGGIEVGDSFPEYKPHITLGYMPGIDHSDWDGEVPQGTWDFKGMEVWGLPKVHKIRFGPSFYKVSEMWLHKKATWAVYAGAHAKSIALMKWLSEATRKLGVSRDTYVVGGAVRNFIIDQPIKDIDVVLDSVAAGHDSDWLAEKLSRMIPGPTNVTTNQYGVAILTVKGDWELDGENMKGEVVEIANARKESYGGEGGKGYKPSEVSPGTIEEDVARRDFTVNTLMWRLLDLATGPEQAEVIDLMGCGKRDLEEGVLRCPQDPDRTFSDDPTRMLRLVRLASKYNLKVSSDVAAAVRRNAHKLKTMPWEAVASILMQILEGR